jgi:hypothetical protein
MRWDRQWAALPVALAFVAACSSGQVGDEGAKPADSETATGGIEGEPQITTGGSGGNVEPSPLSSGGTQGGFNSGGSGGSKSNAGGMPSVPANTGGNGSVASGGAGGMPTGGIGGTPALTDTIPVGWKKTVLVVGYGGMRVATQDQGVSWTKVAQLTRGGGDDRELLRSAAFGKGRWIAAGWRMFSSDNGTTWTEGKVPDGCGLMEGAAYGNGVFIGTCGEQAYLSDDGITWRKGGRVGSTNGHTYVLFGNGVFAASGDSGNSFTSTDGKVWSPMPNLRKVQFCQDQMRSEGGCAGDAWFATTYYRGAWRGKLERSTNGSSWATTYTDDWDNSSYRFSEGYMPALK